MPTDGRRLPMGLALAVTIIAIVTAGCGASALPAGWSTVALPSGAVLPYPPGWQKITGDPGSASAAVVNADGTIRAYLNATPAVARETLTGWTRFRLRHVAEDGDTQIRLLSARTDVALGAGRESCVTDQYTTSRTSYRELACLVMPGHGARGDVLVAAAQPGAWAREHPSLVFALRHFVS